jgi:hypothetical protein
MEPTMRVVMLPLRVMLSSISGHHCRRRKRGKVNRELEGFWGGDFGKEI